jgi:hypothetical protein
MCFAKLRRKALGPRTEPGADRQNALHGNDTCTPERTCAQRSLLGGRQGTSVTSTNVITYAYPQDAQGRDAANRPVRRAAAGLTNVDTLAGTGGMTYTWDDNPTLLRCGDWRGNLLNDGSKTYTYPQDAQGRTQANWLRVVNAGNSNWSATYNGDPLHCVRLCLRYRCKQGQVARG